MEDNKTAIGQAMELFGQQKYEEAFFAFAKIYNQSTDKEERKRVFNTLAETFYTPNLEDFQADYARNVQLLEKYPYFFGKAPHRYEELTFQLFPVSDELFYCYDKQKDRFSGEYDAATDKQMRYFFENTDEPLFVENEDNFYNLNYLNDNVRASEDYGGDNHIYLFYETPEPLERLMVTCDLEPVLQQKKFVFLIGEENKKRYPVDFLKEFDIDYKSMSPTPVRVEEIKRICCWHYHARSGTEISLAVIGSLNEVQKISGHKFNTNSFIDGNWILAADEYLSSIADVNAVYTADKISEIFHSDRYKYDLPDSDDFVDWLRQHRPAPHEYTVKELFCAYFLFYYEKRDLNPRIAPLLLYDPHTLGKINYSDLIRSFPYHTVMTCVREPVMTFIRCQQVGVVGSAKNTTQYLLAHDYLHMNNPELQSCFYAIRFEDLKTKPEITCRSICRHLNLPYDKVMLEADAPDRLRQHDVKGCFDTAPLHWDISDYLSDFDKVRLRMFYAPILKHYGYPTFSVEKYPLPEYLVRLLFQIPFRFELKNAEIHNEKAPPFEELHKWVQDILQTLWGEDYISPKLIPLEEPT